MSRILLRENNRFHQHCDRYNFQALLSDYAENNYTLNSFFPPFFLLYYRHLRRILQRVPTFQSCCPMRLLAFMRQDGLQDSPLMAWETTCFCELVSALRTVTMSRFKSLGYSLLKLFEEMYKLMDHLHVFHGSLCFIFEISVVSKLSRQFSRKT